jgi:short chain dehydrogenase
VSEPTECAFGRRSTSSATLWGLNSGASFDSVGARSTACGTPRARPARRGRGRWSVVSEPRLAGKRVIVTGAGRGLGREFALHLARLGARVIGADVRADRLAATVEDGRNRGLDIHAATTDVSDPEQTRPRRHRARGARRARCARQQRRNRRRPGAPPVRRYRRSRVGPRTAGQRYGHLAVREGGRSADTRGGRGLDREHGLGGRVLGLAWPRALRHLEGGHHRADSCALPRAWSLADPSERARPRIHPNRRKHHDDRRHCRGRRPDAARPPRHAR